MAISELSNSSKISENHKENPKIYENNDKTHIIAPKKLEKMHKNDTAKAKINEFHKFAAKFWYGLLSKISDKNVNLQLFNENSEPILTKLISTLSKILLASTNLTNIMNLIKDGFPIIFMLLGRKNQELRLQVLYFAMILTDSIKVSLMDEEIVNFIEKLHENLLELISEEPIEKCKEISTVVMGIIQEKIRQFSVLNNSPSKNNNEIIIP